MRQQALEVAGSIQRLTRERSDVSLGPLLAGTKLTWEKSLFFS